MIPLVGLFSGFIPSPAGTELRGLRAFLFSFWLFPAIYGGCVYPPAVCARFHSPHPTPSFVKKFPPPSRRQLHPAQQKRPGFLRDALYLLLSTYTISPVKGGFPRSNCVGPLRVTAAPSDNPGINQPQSSPFGRRRCTAAAEYPATSHPARPQYPPRSFDAG